MNECKFASRNVGVISVGDVLFTIMLTYCCEVLVYSNQQISQLNIVCWDAYRKAFRCTCNLLESVKKLQLFCEMVDLKHLYSLFVSCHFVEKYQDLIIV